MTERQGEGGSTLAKFFRYGWRPALLAGVLWACPSLLGAQETKPDSGFSDGTKLVVLLGSGLVEEDQASAYIETRLARRFPDRRILFRNMGWTGDTVWGGARTNGYQVPARLERLKKQTSDQKPDLVFLGYGLAESFDGPAGLGRFSEGYGKLLDLLTPITPHLVLLSPAPHEDLGRPYPDPAEHNKSLEAYSAAIRKIAEERRLPFVDLFHPLLEARAASPRVRFSTNGILLDDAGYWKVALEIERQLGLLRPPWRLKLHAGGELKSSEGVRVSEIASRQDALEWKSVEEQLPAPPAPSPAGSDPAWSEDAPVLAVAGLRDGRWTLRANGQEVASAPAAEWEKGVPLRRGPSFDQVETLRRSMAKRNNLFTRRWRPINDWPAHYTYLAPDLEAYDRLLPEQDELVATQSKPVTQSYSLTLQKP
jgi:lysophospholipase L1-like esterase